MHFKSLSHASSPHQRRVVRSSVVRRIFECEIWIQLGEILSSAYTSWRCIPILKRVTSRLEVPERRRGRGDRDDRGDHDDYEAVKMDLACARVTDARWPEV